MNKMIFIVPVLLFIGNILVAQNILSPVWKISFSDTSIDRISECNIDEWKNVNLLLSWERQGFFWQNGKCCLASDFNIPDKYIDSALTLTVGLQCNVRHIFINGVRLGGDIQNSFWSDRGAKTSFAIPRSCLYPHKPNRIAIIASDLSYTGGRSYNDCRIHPSRSSHEPDIEISIPYKEHLVTADRRRFCLKIKTKTEQKGSVSVTIRNDYSDSVFSQKYIIGRGHQETEISPDASILRPGFYECIAILNDGTYQGTVEWFAVSPEKLECKYDTVQGFKNFWQKALKELGSIQPEFKVHKVDSLSAGKRDGYIVEMISLGNIIIRGYYFVPRSPGQFPAILHLPGYGYGFEHLDRFLNCRDNVIELALCVRGHGISADVFNPGFGVPGIWGYRFCNENENSYRPIYMDCVRGVEFLISRSEVDKKRIGVEGGSQGGGLALATAGLCNEHISACAYFDPFPCDIREHLKIRTIINQEIRTFLNYYSNECDEEQALHVQDLINTRGFAYWIKCPVFYATSLFDDDCPPRLGFSAFNIIKSRKKFKIYPGDSHLCETSEYEDIMIYFKNVFRYRD